MSDDRYPPCPTARQSTRLPRRLGVLALTLAGAAFAHAETGGAARGALSAERVAQLTYMVREDCGSCHGMTLKGGLGPPLLPAQLAGKPPEYLKAVILNGSYGSAMPGWLPLLSETDAGWIAERLLQGFPDAR